MNRDVKIIKQNSQVVVVVSLANLKWLKTHRLRGNQGCKFPACSPAGDESIPDAVGSRGSWAQLGMVSPSRITWTQLSTSRLS